MCGINGFSWKNDLLIKQMNKKIKHRGPDDDGYFTDENISLGHVRLSILDLSTAGHQPMFYSKSLGASSNKFNKENIEKSSISIVFNGEIYNYLEIKEKLEKNGYKFSTKTDTEVILASYLEWGFDCVKKFNGMWAFCIYDKKKNVLFLSRDRLGQKPLYYYNKNDKFIFSSELKGILEHKNLEINKKENLSKESIELYFSLGFIPSPYSIFKDVYKLEASHNLVFDIRNKKIKKWHYWELPKYRPIYNKKKLIKKGKYLLKDAVKIRMRSDVPVGAFLSGGLDSSTVVGVMKQLTDSSKLHTFSIGFEGKYDETPYINIVKDYLKTNHHHYYFKEKDFENLIDKYSEIYDEPFGNYSGFPTYKVSELAKKYVTVSLSGDGGDEIFGGYINHLNGYRLDLIKKIPKPLRIIISKIPIKKNLNGIANLYLLREAFKVSLLKPELVYAGSMNSEALRPNTYKKWTVNKLKYSLDKGGNKLGEAFRINDLLFYTLSDNFLVKVDRASMATSLEVRSPFLDYRFAEFSQQIPTSWKQDLFKTKKIMREIIKDILPYRIVNRGKQGFSPPLENWILNKKYLNFMKKNIKVIKDLNNEIYSFYKEKVFKEINHSMYRTYLIRLFLFIKWWERWVEEV